MTIPCIAIVNKILCHRYRSCEFSRVIKQYAIRKNDLSKKEKMLQTNRQTLRKKRLEKMTLLSHFVVRVACIRSNVQVARQTSIVVSPIPHGSRHYIPV